MLRYRFVVEYKTKHLSDVLSLLNCLDLGEIDMSFKKTLLFDYSGKKKRISYFKGLITRGFESVGFTVIKVEGGCVE